MSRRLCLLVIAACSSSDGSDTLPACNALSSTGCVLPWPSSLYERPDESSPTGYRLDLPPGALPASYEGVPIDPAWINRRTGFSPMSQILLTFPGGVDGANLPGPDNIAASLDAASPTVI